MKNKIDTSEIRLLLNKNHNCVVEEKIEDIGSKNTLDSVKFIVSYINRNKGKFTNEQIKNIKRIYLIK